MSIPKIITSFDRLSDAELSTLTQTVETSVNGNPHFPEPVPPISEVSTKKEEFTSSVVAAKSGDRTKIAIKKEKRASLVDTVHQLARYVELSSNGNRSIMLSSGFEVSKEYSTAVELGTIKNIKLSNGENNGEVIISCSSVQGAKSYLYQYTLDPLTPDSIWQGEPETSSSHKYKGLQTGKKYWFRVVVVGSNSQQTISDPIARFVQ